MKITRRQLRSMILKEIRNITEQLDKEDLKNALDLIQQHFEDSRENQDQQTQAVGEIDALINAVEQDDNSEDCTGLGWYQGSTRLGDNT